MTASIEIGSHLKSIPGPGPPDIHGQTWECIKCPGLMASRPPHRDRARELIELLKLNPILIDSQTYVKSMEYWGITATRGGTVWNLSPIMVTVAGHTDLLDRGEQTSTRFQENRLHRHCTWRGTPEGRIRLLIQQGQKFRRRDLAGATPMETAGGSRIKSVTRIASPAAISAGSRGACAPSSMLCWQPGAQAY